MSKLALMISTEYRQDVRSKSFWIVTFVLPVFIVGFSFLIGYLTEDNDAMQEMSKHTSPGVDENLSTRQLIGMISGVFLTMFLVMYGSQIFNKVKTEKCNRIVEVLISSVTGRTSMLAKVVSVALSGLTQMGIWAVLCIALVLGIAPFIPGLDLTMLLTWQTGLYLAITLAYFVGGFLFYGALFAAAGALTDRNNENQGYLSVLMLLLMTTFYIGIYSVSSPGSPLSVVCFYLPFTSSTVGVVETMAGSALWWQTIISLAVLYASAFFSVSLAGKIYTSAILLKGKKFSFKDILVFVQAK